LQGDVAGTGTHGDINAHIIDLGRYLVGEVAEVCATMETFIKQRPLATKSGGLSAKGADGKKMGEVTVDDAVLTIGRFQNGALMNLEATRFALGRKNAIQVEINGSKGSLYFDFEDMNRLKYYDGADRPEVGGFRDIHVGDSSHPYVGNWWPVGHIIGYEHTFIHAVVDFLHAIKKGKSVQPTFRDGYINQVVLDTISRSAQTRRWLPVNVEA
jgi:predicted dehydrogenase